MKTIKSELLKRLNELDIANPHERINYLLGSRSMVAKLKSTSHPWYKEISDVIDEEIDKITS